MGKRRDQDEALRAGSGTVDHWQGRADRESPYRKAEDRVVEIARENDILEKAQANAEGSIRTLMTSSGYERVVFQ